MGLAVCRLATIRRGIYLLALVLGVTGLGAQPRAGWRKIGPSAVELSLASPAGGPVQRVWFSVSGSSLFAQTAPGLVFQTADFEQWSPAPEATPPPVAPATAVRLPEPGAALVGAGGAQLFALKRNVYRSDDGGRSWTNLTSYKSQAVIGAGQNSVAVSPANPDEIVIGNNYGVWRSLDGGMTWTGLNENLPSIEPLRILSTPRGAAGARIAISNWTGAVELLPGIGVWAPSPSSAELEQDEARKSRYSEALGAKITAVASAGDVVYAGSGDGRIWSSSDGGATFQISRLPVGVTGPVAGIYADSAQPQAALAALGGDGAHVLRTFNGGVFWDAMDSDLPQGPVNAVVADRQSGAVYVAGSKGVYWTTVDLATAGSLPHWTDLSNGLPSRNALDVRLDPEGVQVYVAIEGYGVFATAAPHRRAALRLINAADFSTRAAAPGSLLSVVGAYVSSARGENLDYPILGAPSDSESQIQVPFGASGPMVSLAINTNEGLVTLGLRVQPVSPAVFVGRDGTPMIYDADTGLPVDGRNPALSGGRIQVFATGLGKVRPEWPAGVATPLQNPPVVTAGVKAFLDGAPLQVTKATLAPGYVGFYLIEVQLPVVANFGSSQLYLNVDGQESNRVQLIIEP